MKFNVLLLLALVLCITIVYAKKSDSESSSTTVDPIDSDLDEPEETSSESSGGKKKTSGKSKTCGELENDFDKTVRKLLFIEGSFPKNVSEIDDQCSLATKFYKKAKTYSARCLTGLPKQLFSLYVRGLKKLIRRICNSPSAKENILNTLSCSTDESHNGWKYCISAANRQFHYAADNVTTEELFSYSCCMYPVLEECLEERVTGENCKTKTTLSDFVRSMTDTVMRDLLEFVCAKWDKTTCLTDNAEAVKVLKQLQEDTTEPEGIVILTPLLKLVPRLTT